MWCNMRHVDVIICATGVRVRDRREVLRSCLSGRGMDPPRHLVVGFHTVWRRSFVASSRHFLRDYYFPMLRAGRIILDHVVQWSLRIS